MSWALAMDPSNGQRVSPHRQIDKSDNSLTALESFLGGQGSSQSPSHYPVQSLDCVLVLESARRVQRQRTTASLFAATQDGTTSFFVLMVVVSHMLSCIVYGRAMRAEITGSPVHGQDM